MIEREVKVEGNVWPVLAQIRSLDFNSGVT